MPLRLVPLVEGEYYHIFNRGVNKQEIFNDKRDYQRAIDSVNFYSYSSQKPKYSRFLKLPFEEKKSILNSLQAKENKLIEIISYCLMPNHFHFLIKQSEENGISTFMRLFQNSYTRYFNTKHNRIGPLLQGQFKAVRVEDDSQLLHLSRYIHLNPFTSFLVTTLEKLEEYSFSSYPEFLGNPVFQMCNKDIILSQFSEIKDYKQFIEDGSSYQRELAKIKHLTLENDSNRFTDVA